MDSEASEEVNIRVAIIEAVFWLFGREDYGIAQRMIT